MLAIAYCVASRLAYILFTGIALRRQERDEAYTRTWGVEGGFQRFRRVVSVLMVNDVFAFGLLCLVTRDTLEVAVPRAAVIVGGLALIAVGIAVKVWAANTLGGDAYYWYNFFSPPRSPHIVLAGPYRFLANPMYTVGYLQAYGFAFVMG
ncbi:MAG TPA: methyltransferase, partial [Gemmatimonadales bacterium]|nr:methyltransferase [Gemmatimonadales bacterium]